MSSQTTFDRRGLVAELVFAALFLLISLFTSFVANELLGIIFA